MRRRTLFERLFCFRRRSEFDLQHLRCDCKRHDDVVSRFEPCSVRYAFDEARSYLFPKVQCTQGAIRSLSNLKTNGEG